MIGIKQKFVSLNLSNKFSSVNIKVLNIGYWDRIG